MLPEEWSQRQRIWHRSNVDWEGQERGLSESGHGDEDGAVLDEGGCIKNSNRLLETPKATVQFGLLLAPNRK